MATVRQRAAARRDLVEHFVHLAESAGLDIAERFLRQAETTFNALAEQPMIGAPLTLKYPDLAGDAQVASQGSEAASTTEDARW
ncbi:MAG: type II toxin-antitoxin system RelE/ParE family toxin [Caldimonas sp.]